MACANEDMPMVQIQLDDSFEMAVVDGSALTIAQHCGHGDVVRFLQQSAGETKRESSPVRQRMLAPPSRADPRPVHPPDQIAPPQVEIHIFICLRQIDILGMRVESRHAGRGRASSIPCHQLDAAVVRTAHAAPAARSGAAGGRPGRRFLRGAAGAVGAAASVAPRPATMALRTAESIAEHSAVAIGRVQL